MLETMLELIGHDVVIAPTADAGLRQFIDDGRFDLVVSDIHVPGTLNGTELANRVKAISDVPVLLISGYSTAAHAHLDRSGTAFLAKPFSFAILKKSIDEVMRSHANALLSRSD